MSGTSKNLSDALRYREAVSLFLNLSGHADAEARPMRKLSESIGASSSDVRGVPGWYLSTSSRTNLRLTDDLTAAQSEAREGERVAVIQHLRAKPLSDSLVVMRLSEFAALTAPPP